VLYACKGVYTIEIIDLYGPHSLHQSEREREKEEGRVGEREEESEKEVERNVESL
jgi:hypothetical protein